MQVKKTTFFFQFDMNLLWKLFQYEAHEHTSLKVNFRKMLIWLTPAFYFHFWEEGITHEHFVCLIFLLNHLNSLI